MKKVEENIESHFSIPCYNFYYQKFNDLLNVFP